MGVIATLLQGPVGHEVGHMVAQYQPIKLAAMEAQFETTDWAPLRIGGVPDMEARQTNRAVEIPGGLSFIAYGDPSSTVRGLNEFPADNLPPVPVVHFAFQAMVGIGTLLIGLGVWIIWRAWRKQPLSGNKLLLVLIVASGPLSIVALEAGWIVTEVGRQPWIVHGVMRTAEAVTESPGVVALFAVTITVYAILAVGTVVTLQLLSRTPLPENSDAA